MTKIADRLQILRSVTANSLRPGSLAFALFSAAFVALSLCVLNVHYTINDDTAIIANVMGGYPIRYVGIVLTSLLHFAYVTAPNIAWLGIVLYTLHVVSLYTWLSLVWKVFRPGWLATICTLAVLGYYVVFLVELDYTAVSVMLCMAGITWACLLVVEGQPGYVPFLGSGVLFMLGMMVRPQGAPGALAYGLPLIVLTLLFCFQTWQGTVQIRRLALIGLLFFIPAVFNFAADGAWRHIILSPQQANYDAFNSVRGDLHRLNRARKRAIMDNEMLLASVHWTRHDAEYFFDWKFLDERTYNVDALQTLLAGAPTPQFTRASLLPLVMRSVSLRNPLFLIITASLPLFLLLLVRRPLLGVCGVFVPVYSVCLTALMYFMFAFTFRVELPFVTGVGFGGLLLGGLLARPSMGTSDPAYSPAALLAAIIALIGMGLSMGGILDNQQNLGMTAERVQEKLQVLNHDYAGSVLLVEPGVLHLDVLSPLDPIDLHFQTIDLGWNTFSPRFYHAIGALGVEHGYELMDSLVNRDHAYLMANPQWCKDMLAYINGYPQRDIQVQLVTPVYGHIGVYRLVEAAKLPAENPSR